MQEVLSKLTPEDLVHGQISLARFMVDNYLTEDGKRKYICTDTARQTCQFENEHGFLDKDVRCQKLSDAMVKNKL